MASGTEIAQKNFELENNIVQMDDTAIYMHDEVENERLDAERPWKDDPNFFKKVKISAVALIKMVMHTRSGGTLEVMGLMRGKALRDGTFMILDAFPLPVEGTETRVNAGASANEFMINFNESCERVDKNECICGWYHSHPGYGCWLSGIDVQTQKLYQSHQEPFLAIVIDPTRTVSAGKVEIGAFRTYPDGHTPQDIGPEYQTIPLDKIEDFGVHFKQYYTLPIEIFKNSVDNKLLELLWNKYWIDTLSASPLMHNKSFCIRMIKDTVQKLEQIDTAAVTQSRFRMVMHEPKKTKAEDQPLSKVAQDANKNAVEQLQGLTNLMLKHSLFHCGCCRAAQMETSAQA